MRTLPDYLRRGMKLVIVSLNPSEQGARVGHYYAGRGNVFWTLLYEGGVVAEHLSYNDDRRIIEFGIGLTNLVSRPTKTEEEIGREEFGEGRILLAQKIEQFSPRVVAFNGKLTYEKFAQRPGAFGLQESRVYGSQMFVLPSTTGAEATVRGQKVRYFKQLARVLAEENGKT
jgi:double-stranded uracil-DNA glycosylase